MDAGSKTRRRFLGAYNSNSDSQEDGLRRSLLLQVWKTEL